MIEEGLSEGAMYWRARSDEWQRKAEDAEAEVERLKAEIERVRRDKCIVYASDQSSRAEMSRLRAQIAEWKARAEANAATAHALEVIEREGCDLTHFPNLYPGAFQVRRVGHPRDVGTGFTVSEAVADYERRKGVDRG